MKFRMHILEDLSQLSERAQDLLRRTGRRERPTPFELPVELWHVRDRTGRSTPAPMDLIIRLEGFEQRFGGLRYVVRHSRLIGGGRYEAAREWEYNHLGVRTAAWQDPRRGGWYFEWIGEHVSKPCRDLIHTDGSVGTDINGSSPYLPLAPSVPHLIESHALADNVAAWRPWPVGNPTADAVALLDGLVDVPEASWGSSRWRLSDSVAVMDEDTWDSQDPRRRTLVWSRDEAGHRQMREALDASRSGAGGTTGAS